MPSQSLWPSHVWIEVAVALVIALLIGLPHLVLPFGSDQGEYAHIASEMLDGKVIYRDVFNVKPPVTHVLHAFALGMFGRSMMTLRILDLIWQSATIVVLVLITALLYRRRFAPLLAGVIYAVTYYSTSFWHSAQTDGFVNLLASLGVLFFLIGLQRRRAIWALFAGGMIGIAVLTKYPIGLLLPFMLLILFLVQGYQRKSLVAGLWIVLGFALPLLLFVLYSGLRGGLGPFLQIQFGYIPQYNSGFAGDQTYLAYSWTRFVVMWDHRPVLRLFVLVWFAEVLLSGIADKWRREQWLVPLWGIAAFVYVAAQNHYNLGHMNVFLPPLAIMIAHLFLNLDALAKRSLPTARPLVALLAIATPFLFLFLTGSPYQQRDLGTRIADLWAVTSGERTLKEHYLNGGFGTFGWGFSAEALVKASDYLRHNTSPDDKIFIWSFEPGVYFLSERESASRFIFNYPLIGDFAWPEYREQFMVEMEATRPAVILVGQRDAMTWVTGTDDDSTAALERFEAFKKFIEGGYRPVEEIGQFTVYERHVEN